MKEMYMAIDGTLFDDMWKCEEYEGRITHPAVFNIDFYDENDDIYGIDENNMFDDHIYNDAEKIVVHNTEEVDALLWIAEYTGWCEFEQITSPGTWVRHEKDMGTYCSYADGIWEKEE